MRRFFSSAPPLTPSLRVLEPGNHLLPVKHAATAVGVHQSESSDWNVLWSYRVPWESAPYRSRVADRPSANAARRLLVNHLPGTLRLASKAHLPSLIREANLSAALTPLSYLLPEDIGSLRRAIAADGLADARGFPRWLLKSRQHRGVRALVNASRARLRQTGSMLAQRRVEPLLLPGLNRAFDIGLYVLVTSVWPLRVYAYEHALVRFCESAFPTAPAEFTARPNAFVINHYAPIWSLPFFAKSLSVCDNGAACALRRELSSHGYNGDGLWNAMRTTAARLLYALRPHVAAGMERVQLSADEAFELFRFDFMVDSHARPVLTEVNISPNLVAAHAEDGKMKDAMLRGLLAIVTPRMKAPATGDAFQAAEAAAAATHGFVRVKGAGGGGGRSGRK